jgi:ComF family protein
MLKGLLSLLLQDACPLCDRPAAEPICTYCQQQLKSCQLKSPSQFWSGEPPLFAWGAYSGKLKQAIATLKYDRHPQIGEVMGTWLAEAWLRSSLCAKNQPLTVVPIPLHPKKQQERGFNQAESIARGFCQVTGDRLQPRGLQRVRDTQAMFGLRAWERENNLKNAFSLGQRPQAHRPNSPVLLVDDIYTTGTTVKEAAKLLRSQKIPVFGAVTLSVAL